jgi:cyclase
MSSLRGDIMVPGRPEVREVSAGIYAYVQPDGTWWINNTGFLVGPQGVGAPRAGQPAGRQG